MNESSGLVHMQGLHESNEESRLVVTCCRQIYTNFRLKKSASRFQETCKLNHKLWQKKRAYSSVVRMDNG